MLRLHGRMEVEMAKKANEEFTHIDTMIYLNREYPDYPCVRCKRVKDRGGCTKTTDCADWAAWFGKTWERFKKGATHDE